VHGTDFIRRPRLFPPFIISGKFFYSTPEKPLNAVVGLGFVEAISYGPSAMSGGIFSRTVRKETFEHSGAQTVLVAGTGFLTFSIEPIPENVWGCPLLQLRPEWVAQRIKNLSLKTAVAELVSLRRE
jgi:hypothetical protein